MFSMCTIRTYNDNHFLFVCLFEKTFQLLNGDFVNLKFIKEILTKKICSSTFLQTVLVSFHCLFFFIIIFYVLNEISFLL